MGAECPHGRIWPQVTRPCEIAGRRKAEEEKGDYSTSSLLRWAPALCWLPALRKWHRCLAGGFGHGSVLHIHPGHPPDQPPGKTRENSGLEQVGKEEDPATNIPSDDAHPQTCLRILLETLIHDLPAAQTLPCCSTETRSKCCSKLFTKYTSSIKLSRQWTRIYFQL